MHIATRHYTLDRSPQHLQTVLMQSLYCSPYNSTACSHARLSREPQALPTCFEGRRAIVTHPRALLLHLLSRLAQISMANVSSMHLIQPPLP